MKHPFSRKEVKEIKASRPEVFDEHSLRKIWEKQLIETYKDMLKDEAIEEDEVVNNIIAMRSEKLLSKDDEENLQEKKELENSNYASFSSEEYEDDNQMEAQLKRKLFDRQFNNPNRRERWENEDDENQNEQDISDYTFQVIQDYASKLPQEKWF